MQALFLLGFARRRRRQKIRLRCRRSSAKGFKIPIVGLGTWALRGRDCARLVEQAIRLGYRHIDTAQMYDNEREVGEGVRASGMRAEVMVTTKVQPTLLAPHDLERSVKESLARLRLDVIDLLLIHWPNPRVPLAETLGAMAKMKREGYARQIGVSNFTVALLEEANKISSEPLVCNQIECHPFLNQDKVIAACKKHGMAVVAYSPIARGGAKDDKVLETIGQAHGKTRRASLPALAGAAGHRGDPAHQQDRAAGGELRAVRLRADRLRKCARSPARPAATDASSIGPGRRTGIEAKRIPATSQPVPALKLCFQRLAGNVDHMHRAVALAGNEQLVAAIDHVHRLAADLDRRLLAKRRRRSG